MLDRREKMRTLASDNPSSKTPVDKESTSRQQEENDGGKSCAPSVSVQGEHQYVYNEHETDCVHQDYHDTPVRNAFYDGFTLDDLESMPDENGLYSNKSDQNESGQ
jgi:hypothetical protein